MEIVLAIVVCAGLAVAGVVHSNKKRRAHLFSKYGDMAIVDRIMAKKIWQGMTGEQLTDSLGKPADIGRKVTRNKTVETYKYGQTGKNRFSSRVVVENGCVTGWEMK